MLAKLTAKNQLTIPKAIIEQFDDPCYFDITAQNGSIVLKPVSMVTTDMVRDKLEQLGITENDIADAVKWARNEK